MNQASFATSAVCVIGASRGLGLEISRALAKKEEVNSLLLVARNEVALKELQAELTAQRPTLNVGLLVLDVSKPGCVEELAQALLKLRIHEIIYSAGGGSHGSYDKQSWKSHLWTMKVNLLTPAELLHWSLNQQELIRRVVLIGSAIAEKAVEPHGASYAAAKAGLLGLVRSIQNDAKILTEVRLYSPGFLDTGLIPQGSWPRRLPNLLVSPERAAHLLVTSLYPG